MGEESHNCVESRVRRDDCFLTDEQLTAEIKIWQECVETARASVRLAHDRLKELEAEYQRRRG